MNIFDVASIELLVKKYGTTHENSIWEEIKKKRIEPCPHDNTEWHEVNVCTDCGKIIDQAT